MQQYPREESYILRFSFPQYTFNIVTQFLKQLHQARDIPVSWVSWHRGDTEKWVSKGKDELKWNIIKMKTPVNFALTCFNSLERFSSFYWLNLASALSNVKSTFFSILITNDIGTFPHFCGGKRLVYNRQNLNIHFLAVSDIHEQEVA